MSSTQQCEGLSLTLQGDASLLEVIADKYNTQISERVYVDSGKSAYSGKNLDSEFGALMTNIRNKKIIAGDVIVMRHLDRLSRLPLLEAIDIFTEILGFGVKIFTTMDNREYSNAPKNRMMSMVLATLSFELANEESVKKSYLTNKHALKRIQQFEDGELAPSGYAYSIGVGGVPFHCTVEEKAVVPDSAKLQIAKDLVKFAISGNSLRKCRDWLENKHGIKYTVAGISNLLKSPSLYGTLIIKIQDRDAIAKLKSETNEAEDIKKTYELKKFFPAVCSEEDYHLLQSVRRKSTSKGNRKQYTLLSGRKILHCGECGSSLVANHTSGKGAVYYTCCNGKCLLSEKIYTINKMVIESMFHLMNRHSNTDDSKLVALKERYQGLLESFSKMQKLIFDNPESFDESSMKHLKKMKVDVKNANDDVVNEQQKHQSKIYLDEGGFKEISARLNKDKNKILYGDSEANKENGDQVAKIIKDILIYKDGLVKIVLINFKTAYFYMPKQIRTAGRRLAVQLTILEPKDKLYIELKNDNDYKMISFSEDDILNNEYRCSIEDIHPSFLRLYSEEHTQFTAADRFTNSILEQSKSIGYVVFNKKSILGNCSITSKQWQTYKDKSHEILVKKGCLYRLNYETQLGNKTEVLVVSENDFSLYLDIVKVEIDALKIFDYKKIQII